MSTAGLEIRIFEYELAGYQHEDDADSQPQVYTESLKASKKECPLLQVSGGDATGDTRTCDVLEGVVGTTIPSPDIANNFAEKITISLNNLPPLHLSDLLLITTQFPTKLEARPSRDEFNAVIQMSNNKDSFSNFYELDFIHNLMIKIIDVLKAPWTNMVTKVEEVLEELRTSGSDDVPPDLVELLLKKGTSSTIPSLTTILNNSQIIDTYTMIKYHEPVINEQYIIIGDLHGSLATFVRLLYRWKLLGYLDETGMLQKQNGRKLHILFLGDIADRGVWGYEIYYTLFYLYFVNQENPNGEFFITRGNHEEAIVNSRENALLDQMKIIFNHTTGDPFLPHDYINNILSYFPSAHQIKYPNQSQFVYLAHGGYPLESTTDCANPTVVSLPPKDVFVYDEDIKVAGKSNSIRWNDFYSLHHTIVDRGCGIGEDTIAQATSKNYMFTIRAHQDQYANTKLLLKATEEDPDFTRIKIDAHATYLSDHSAEADKDKKATEAAANAVHEELDSKAPKDIREVDIEDLVTCPNSSTPNCKGPIAILHVGLNGKIQIKKTMQPSLLPVLTLTTNTEYGRDLFRDSYTIISFKARESCLTNPMPVPSGLSYPLQTLFRRVHELDSTMNEFILKLESLGAVDKCDIDKYEHAICTAQVNLETTLKEYKDAVQDVGVGAPLPVPKEYKNVKLNGFTVEGSVEASTKRQALDRKYLSNDLRVLVMYGFLERSVRGAVPAKDVTYDDIFDFLEWVTLKTRKGYPYLFAKWLSETRTKILTYGENLTIPLRTQQVLRDQLAQVEASLLVGNVTPRFLKANGENPQKLSTTSGFIPFTPLPPPPPPTKQNTPLIK